MKLRTTIKKPRKDYKEMTKQNEIEILTLFYNGFTNLKSICEIVGYSLPTISRTIGKSFEQGVNLNKGVFIVSSKLNFLTLEELENL